MHDGILIVNFSCRFNQHKEHQLLLYYLIREEQQLGTVHLTKGKGGGGYGLFSESKYFFRLVAKRKFVFPISCSE